MVLDRCAGDLRRVRRLGLERFAAAVRRELPRWGGIRPRLRIIRAVFAALADPAGGTGPARSSARTWHWATGGIPAPGSPIPRPGWPRSWMTSG